MGGDEVLEDRHPLAEVAPHGDVDDPARRVGHEAAHRAQLADVALVAAGTRRGHHRDRAERIEAVHHRVRHLGRGLLPDADHLLVALLVGDEAALELAIDLVDLVVGASQALGLVARHRDVAHRDRHAAAGGELEADALDAVDEVRRLLGPEQPVAVVHQLLERRALHVDVLEPQRRRQDLVEDDPADRGAQARRDEPASPSASSVGSQRQDLGVDRLVER